jgi:hypothetical protein
LNLIPITQDNVTNDTIVNTDKLEDFYNYPNPFLKKTRIIYSLPETCGVVIKIYDDDGACIKRWAFSHQSLGKYLLEFNAENFESGVYHCQLLAKGKSVFISKVIKMIHTN